MDIEGIRREIEGELFDNCLPFWLDNGLDREHGGMLTSLDRSGFVYATDKSIWFQGRAAYIFSRLCNVYGTRPEWLEAARSCLDFAQRHGFVHGTNRMLFSVTRSGQPLRLRRYHFSEQFFAMACAEYAVASGDMDYMRRAREMAMYAWDLASSRIADISGYPAKVDAGTRATLTLAEPLMLLTTFSTLLGLDDCNRDEYDTICTQMAEDIVHRHLHIENKFVYENVPLCGVLDESQPYGRLMNPGHVIEGSWILLDYARQANREDLAHAAILMFRYAYEAGWDAEYGGLFSFVDRLGYPPEPIEHDMKYWWPHCELLIASLKMALDGDESCREIFDGTWRYCRDHFIDGRHGEWFGYLRRDGSPVEPGPKGNMFKGPFHVPRALMMVERLLAGCESVPPVHEQG